MSVTYIGGMNLRSAVPGLDSALGELSKAIGQLDLLKADKSGLLQQSGSDLGQLFTAYTAAQTALTEGQKMIEQADAILDQARGIASGLMASIGGAGVSVYRFDGNVGVMGGELTAAMQAQGQQGAVTAVVFIASDGGAVSAMSKVFNLG